MLLGLIGYAVVTVLAILAPSFWILVALRALMVTFGGALSPNGGALIRLHLPPARRAGAFGSVAAAISAAATIGPLIGGVLAALLGWRSIFLATLPFSAVAIALALRAIPPDPPRAPDERVRVDLIGAALLAASVASMIVPLTLLRIDVISLVLLPVAYAALSIVVLTFVWWELRHPEPLVQMRLFTRSTFRSACISETFANVSMFPIAVVASIFMQSYQGYSATATGLVIAVGSVAMVLFSPIGGRLADRRGRRLPALIGRVMILAGAAPLVAVTSGMSPLLLALAMTVVSIGGGMAFAPVQAAAIESAPRHYSGMAAGVFATTSFMGGVLGLTGVSVYLAAEELSIDQFRVIFAVFAATAAAAIAFITRVEPWPRYDEDGVLSPSDAPAN
jgi:MFS family permease